MHKPSMTDILKNNESYYSLVIAVAKRARQVVNEAIDEGNVLIEKPVSVAVQELAKGDYKIVGNQQKPNEE